MIAFRRTAALALLSILGFGPPLVAQGYDPSLFQEMRWRMIGPFRGQSHEGRDGCAVAAERVLHRRRERRRVEDDRLRPHVGSDLRRPAHRFDRRDRASRRPIPNIIYVGSGEGLQRPDLSTGDGIYKSTDAGKTWTHLGLRDGQQIPQIVVDPRDPNRLFVAVLGHPYGPNAERGIFRSTRRRQDRSRRCCTRTRTPAASTSCSIRRTRRSSTPCCGKRVRGRGRTARSAGPGSGLFKSTDGGTTWRQIGKGLPTFEQDGLGRIGISDRAEYAESHVRDGRCGAEWRVVSLGRRAARLHARDGRHASCRARPTSPR